MSVDAWVRDLETVVDALGLERFPLLGMSQGGPIAIRYAARHPERFAEVERMCRHEGLSTIRRSELPIDAEPRADVVVLSKTDRASDLAAVRAEVAAINAHAECIPARFGDIDPAVLQRSGTDHVFSQAAHPAGINSFVLVFKDVVERALLERFLAVLVDLRGGDLLRVKGVVAVEEGGAVLVQGVRHVFDRLRPIAKAPTGLVFITHNLEAREVEALWQAMSNVKGKS